MPHIINRGRYAREVYPQSPVAAGGSQSTILARAWAENVDAVAVSNAAFVTLVALTITPKVTGKFRVTVTGKVVDTSGSTNTWQFFVGSGSDPLAPLYQPGGLFEVPAGPTNGGVAFALVLDPDKFDGTIFPIGVPIRIGVAGATGIGAGSVPGSGVQIEVQEVF